MNISFSTINKSTAKKYLDDKKYDYFSSEAKVLILECVGKDTLRVQDPYMYPSPSLEIMNKEIYNKIKKVM